MEEKLKSIENCTKYLDNSQAKFIEALIAIDDIQYDSTLASIRTRLTECYKKINSLKQELEYNYLN